MGVRLDWDIDSDQSERHGVQEDLARAKQRRRTIVRFVLLLLLFAGILGGVAALIRWRLADSDARIERALRDTVEAEVAALRVGDWNAFRTAQRSATADWEAQQRQYFDAYQNIKATADIELSGVVSGVSIDGQRARVMVEEIIGGVPYAQVWFYWRYEDGWRHVPPDYTFWGTAQEYQGRDVTVVYRDVDEKLALDIGVGVEGWVSSACGAILQCGDLPHITIHIVPDDSLTKPTWDSTNRWRLNVPSPYLVRARADLPFSGAIVLDTAEAVAQRLVEESGGAFDLNVYPQDAYYLRPAVVRWLTGLFAQVEMNAHLIASLATNYGNLKVGELLNGLRADPTTQALLTVTGAPTLDAANLDWRDLLTWRLALENELRQRGDLVSFKALYTTEAEPLATDRFNTVPAADAPQALVTHVEKEVALDGVPQLIAWVRVREDAPEERVLFRLVGSTWKRAN